MLAGASANLKSRHVGGEVPGLTSQYQARFKAFNERVLGVFFEFCFWEFVMSLMRWFSMGFSADGKNICCLSWGWKLTMFSLKYGLLNAMIFFCCKFEVYRGMVVDCHVKWTGNNMCSVDIRKAWIFRRELFVSRRVVSFSSTDLACWGSPSKIQETLVSQNWGCQGKYLPKQPQLQLGPAL